MASNDLSIIIDPGGVDGIRPGINVKVYPDGSTPLSYGSTSSGSERVANANLKKGGFNERLEFNWNSTVIESQYKKIMALNSFNIKAKAALEPWEVVLYNLADTYSEISEFRTRYKVPDTTVIQQVDLGMNLYLWEYYVAIQGALSISDIQRKGKLYRLTFNFKEGTKLLKDMEG